MDWTIEFYIDARGRSPVDEYIAGLQLSDKVRVIRTLQLLQEFGISLREPYTKCIDKDLWELRTGSNRLFYFLHVGRKFVILHGYQKKTNKAPPGEIQIAKRRHDDYLERYRDEF